LEVKDYRKDIRTVSGPVIGSAEWSQMIEEEKRVNVFEVGANRGDQLFWLLQKGGSFYNPETTEMENRAGGCKFHIENENVHYYAFEPTPTICDEIEKKFKDKYPERYHLFRGAVSDVEGKASFNITADPGTSSLNKLSNDTRAWQNKAFSGNLDVIDTIEVDVVRLDTIVRKNNIEKIHYLHIDAQGTDLKVLQSLGDYLSIVEEGCLEVPKHDSLKLYEDHHGLHETLDFLHTNGFTIYYVDPDGENEYDLYFIKNGRPLYCDLLGIPPPSVFSMQTARAALR
jgi:FkbM family methyltransferase